MNPSRIRLAHTGTSLVMLFAVSSAACSAIRPPRQAGTPELRGTEVASAMLTSSTERTLPVARSEPTETAEDDAAAADESTASEAPVIELDEMDPTPVVELDELPVIELDEPRVAELAESPIIELDDLAVEVAASKRSAPTRATKKAKTSPAD